MVALYLLGRMVWAFFVLMAQVFLLVVMCVLAVIAWVAYALVPHNKERRGVR